MDPTKLKFPSVNLSRVIAQLKAQIEALLSDSDMFPDEKLEDLIDDDLRALDKLAQAARDRDQKQILAQTHYITNAHAKIVDKALRRADKKDSATRNQIIDACNALNKLTPEIVMGAKAVLASDSVDAQNKLNDTIQKTKGVVTTLRDQCAPDDYNVSPPKTGVDQSQDLLEAIEGLKKAIRDKDAKGILEFVQRVIKDAKIFIAKARAYAEHVCPEEYNKTVILNSCNEIESLLPELVQASGPLIKNPDDSVAAKQVSDIIVKIQTNVDVINKAMGVNKAPSVAVSTGPDFSAFDTVETSDQALKLAAATVDSALAAYPDEPGTIQHTAKLIADLFSRMADALKNGSKEELLACTQEIAKLIKSLYDQAEQMSKKCPDKHLVNTLMIGANACRNKNVQLKILAAVKVSMGKLTDPAAEHQLIGCVKEISMAIVQTVGGYEACKIKAK